MKWPVVVAASVLALAAVPRASSAEFSVTSDRQDAVKMTGDIRPGDYQKLRALVRNQSAKGDRVNTLVLNSEGGDVGTGYQLAAVVKSLGLTTVVDGTCASMCTTVFAAGSRRILVFGSLLGVHSATSVAKDGIEVFEDESAMAATVRLVRLMKSYGTPEVVIAKLVSTPSTEMAWLDKTDMAGWVEIVDAYGALGESVDAPSPTHEGGEHSVPSHRLIGQIGEWTISQGQIGGGAACLASRAYSGGTTLVFFVAPDERSWLFLTNEQWSRQGNTQVRLDFVDEGIKWSGNYGAFADEASLVLPLDRASANKLMDAEIMTATVGGVRATPPLSLTDSRAAGKAAAACARKS